jgi:hypothetical protein
MPGAVEHPHVLVIGLAREGRLAKNREVLITLLGRPREHRLPIVHGAALHTGRPLEPCLATLVEPLLALDCHTEPLLIPWPEHRGERILEFPRHDHRVARELDVGELLGQVMVAGEVRAKRVELLGEFLPERQDGLALGLDRVLALDEGIDRV